MLDSKNIWVYVIMKDLYIQEMNGSIDTEGNFTSFYSTKVYKGHEYYISREHAEIVRFKLAQIREQRLIKRLNSIPDMWFTVFILTLLSLMSMLIFQLIKLK